jgi:IS30 family transposase
VASSRFPGDACLRHDGGNPPSRQPAAQKNQTSPLGKNQSTAAPLLICWSIQEIRRIAIRLARKRIQPAHIIAWSFWRRAHQAAAQRAHFKKGNCSAKPADRNGDRRGHLKDIVSIRQRPAAVEDRAVPGHWEGDLLSGPNNSYIATLVERHTRYVMLAKVAGKDTQTVVSALIKQAKKLPKKLYKSLTWDRGKELTDHRRFTLATKIDVYFCDPQSPWQRGSNENTNGLLRQYFPKGTDLSVHSQAYLNKVARQLNERPRETLQFETPAERFNGCVASTG